MSISLISKAPIGLVLLASTAQADEHQYLAVATGATQTVDTNYGQRVTGFGRGASPETAAAEAMIKCRSHGDKYPDAAAKCAVVLQQQTGCLFYIYGGTPWGDSGMSFGSTPQDAYNSCHSLNGPMDCLAKVKGECTDAPFVREWPRIVEGEKVKAWFGLSIEIETEPSGRHRKIIAIGRAWGSNEGTARASARIDCNSKMHKWMDHDCDGRVLTFETGCHYVAYSFKADGRTPVAQLADTSGKAQALCLANGGDELRHRARRRRRLCAIRRYT